MKKTAYMFLVFSFVVVIGVPALCAKEDFKENYGEAETSYSDPSAFEGDSGSMTNERAPEDYPTPDMSEAGSSDLSGAAADQNKDDSSY
jgi:hypothetical protein